MIHVPGFIAAVAAFTALVGLLVGAAAHVMRPRMLRDALLRHRVLPASVTGAAALAVTGIELVLAATGTVAFVVNATVVLATVLWLSAGTFAVYAAYSRYVSAKGLHVPCGCSRTEVPMDDWVTFRAVGFTVCAVGGALLAGSTPTDATQWVVAVLATATLALALWQLPAAMRQPALGGS